MSPTATLREVAEVAGVSIGTASQALNNRPNVSHDTRTRVLDAAMTLGYPIKDQNGVCEAPMSVIGFMVKHDVDLETEEPWVNPFYSHIERGVESECRKRNISLMLSTIDVDRQNRPLHWPAMISENRVDGLVLSGTFIEDTVDMIKRRVNIPITLVDSYAPGLPFDSILIDNHHGASSAMEHLIGLGHRHIGLVGTNPKSPPGIFDRRMSYYGTLARHEIRDRYVIDSELSRVDAYRAVQELLKKHPQITAIFAANDDSAIGVLNAARDLGLRVPQDLSVIGFDNIDLSREIMPSLSTVHVNKSWLGMLGVRQLLERAQNPDQPKLTVVVSTQLMPRESTAQCSR
jgi:LacI family transcriptional regulator